jgi:hypothetical protein
MAGRGLTIHPEEVGRHQHLETQVDGDVHVRHVFLVLVHVPVLHVLGDILQDSTTVRQNIVSSRTR